MCVHCFVCDLVCLCAMRVLVCELKQTIKGFNNIFRCHNNYALSTLRWSLGTDGLWLDVMSQSCPQEGASFSFKNNPTQIHCLLMP